MACDTNKSALIGIIKLPKIISLNWYVVKFNIIETTPLHC